MKKKILVNLILVIMLGVMLASTVNAATNSFKAELSASSTSLKPGDEITLTLKVSDIKMGDDGINAVEGTIKYDTNVFEAITQTSITSESGWSTTYNGETSNSLNGKFLAVNLSAGTKEDTKILIVKLKVKQDVAKTTETQIDFVDVTSNDGVDLVNVGTKSVKLKVTVPEEPKNEIKNEVKNIEVKPTENKATGTIPQTGVTPAMCITISVIAIVCVYIGIRYRSMRDVK